MPKDPKRRPRKLDYLCVSNRWKSLVISSKVKWGLQYTDSANRTTMVS